MMSGDDINKIICDALQRFVEPRLERIEKGLLDSITLSMTVKHNGEKLKELENSLDVLWTKYRDFKEKNIEIQSQCPKDEIDSMKRWIMALLAGLILQTVGILAKIII